MPGWVLLVGFMIKGLTRIFLLLTLLLAESYTLKAQSTYTIFKGVLEAKDFDPDQRQVIQLNGLWEFYWDQLIPPGDFDNRRDDGTYFEVPSTWDGAEAGGQTLTGTGFATYRLQLIGPFKDQSLALEIQSVVNAYTLWINNVEVARNGTPRTSLENTVPQWLPVTETFVGDSDTLDLVMHIANFRYRRGGLYDPIVFGTEKSLMQRRASRSFGNVLLIVGLLVITVFFVGYYFIAKRHNSLLLFAGLCLTWAFRAFCTNLYLLIQYFPDFNWGIAMKTEFSTMYVALIFGVLYIAKSYPKETNKLFRNVVVIVSILFLLLTLFSSPFVVSHLLTPFHVFAGLSMILIVNIVLKAIVNDHNEAWLNALSIFLLVGLVFYELFSFQGIFRLNYVLLSIGYLLIFLLNALSIVTKDFFASFKL